MRYALVLLTLVMLTGCGVSAPIEGRQDPYSRRQIHFASADLANRTAVGSPVMERKNGLLYVTVPIRSANNLDLHVDYRVTFFNENGAPLETTSWMQAKTLQANVPSYITFNSTSANAADFQVDFRYAE